MIALWWTKRSLDWSSGVMNPKPLSSLNHFTVPVAILFPPALIVLRTRRLLSKGYERWHCDVGQTTQPDVSTLAAATISARPASRHRGLGSVGLPPRGGSGQRAGRQHEAQRGPRRGPT